MTFVASKDFCTQSQLVRDNPQDPTGNGVDKIEQDQKK